MTAAMREVLPGRGEGADEGRGRRKVRPWSAVRAALPALVAYALLRAVGLVTLAVFADREGRDVWPLLTNMYDAIWYKNVVTAGYDHGVGLNGLTNLVFFPLYPGLMAALDPVLAGDPAVPGIVVSWLAGLVAAWGLYAIGAHVANRRAGVALAALWAVLPHAIVESMLYTETLFTASAAWSLYAVLTRRWLTAGGLCLVAGLTRPTAAALVVAVGLACLVAAGSRRYGWRPWVAGALAPLGLLGYLAFVARRMDRLDAYLHLQSDVWGMRFDGGGYTVRTLGDVFTRPQALQLYVVTGVLAVSVVLFGLSIWSRQPWPLLVFSGLVLVLSVGGAGYYHSKARLLIPAFGLLLPVAIGLARTRAWFAVPLVALLGLGSAMFGVYLCLRWGYSP